MEPHLNREMPVIHIISDQRNDLPAVRHRFGAAPVGKLG